MLQQPSFSYYQNTEVTRPGSYAEVTTIAFAPVMQPNNAIGFIPVKVPIPQKVTLGPIIGKVTHSTARVLVQFAQYGFATLSLVASDGKTIHCQRQVIANRPTVFEFTGLESNTVYKVVSAYKFQCSSSFKTLSQGSAPLRVAFVSCNSRRSYNQYNDTNKSLGWSCSSSCQ